MTKQEAIEIIKRACVEANPSIMDLKFGCEVKIKGKNTETKIIGFWPKGFFQAGKENAYFVINPTRKAFYLEDFEEILGRPIRLADVLLAIHAQTADRKVTGFWTVVGENGEFAKLMLHEGELENCNIAWNLLQDDLTKQNEECLTFLAGLLK